VAKRMRTRKVIQVTNKTLGKYVDSTKKGYLEVVVPANKGHVFFRYGKEVFDFYPKGFRVGTVRPIGSERYGMLIPLNKKQERRLQSYLKRLKKTGGKELGKYDFHGEEGFHCVSWMMRLAMAGKQHGGSKSLAEVLGGGKKIREAGMPRFSRFMLKKAAPVEAVVVYNNDGVKSQTELSRMSFALMSSRQIRRANREMIGD